MTARYMLDTNICIAIRQRRPERVLQRFRALRPGEMVMSPITRGELLYGLEKIRGTPGFDAAMRTFGSLAQMIPVIPLTAVTTDHYAVFRAKLQKAGLMIGNNDLWIAAHASGSDLTLVTNNTREFDRLKPDLKIENWVEDAAVSGA